MKNTSGLTINEIKLSLFEIFDKEVAENILNTYNYSQIITIIEQEDKKIITQDEEKYNKHSPSKKKRANRVKKDSIKYKKMKRKKWIEKRRSAVGQADTNNRTFLNKSTKKYTKLKPHVKFKLNKDKLEVKKA